MASTRGIGAHAKFSLRAAVKDSDAGLYTCNLHHHYCHLYESLAVRLEVTDDRECAGH